MRHFHTPLSSILLVYEGHTAWNSADATRQLVDVRLIDFAHSYYSEKRDLSLDDGVVFGLQNLHSILLSL